MPARASTPVVGGCTVTVESRQSVTCSAPIQFTNVPTRMYAHSSIHDLAGSGDMHIDWIRYADIAPHEPVVLAQWDCESLLEPAAQQASLCRLHDTFPYIMYSGNHEIRVTARARTCGPDLWRCTMHGAIEFS